MLFWNHHMIFESSHKHATVAKTCLCQPEVRPALLAPHSTSFSCWFHAWDFQKSLRCFSAQVSLTYSRGLSESPPAVSYSPVWMNKEVKDKILLPSVVLLPFLLVPVILWSNSKPADIKESNFTRVAFRPPPAQGEMPILSHRTSTRQ